MYHNILYREAIKKTESKDEQKVIEGIKVLRESGKPEAVAIIVNIILTNKNDDIKNECIKFLNDIKDQKAVPFIVQSIKQTSGKEIQELLVSCAWQNNLDYSEFLDDFVEIVIKATYQTAYESFTVIENNIDRLSSEHIEKIVIKLRNAINKVEKEKQPMLQELLNVIDDIR